MSDQQEKPEITLKHEQVICARHGEVFRESWPAGYVVFSVKSLALITQDDLFQKQCRRKAERIGKLLSRKPICCRLSRDQLLQLYQESSRDTDFGSHNECVSCGALRLGAPCRSRCPETGVVLRHTHLCFECFLDYMRPLEAR